MIDILIVFLILMTIISFYFSKKDYLSTPVVLNLAFLGMSVMAYIYKDVWLLDLSINTFLVISLGIGSYCLAYFFYMNNASSEKGKENIFINKKRDIKIRKLIVPIFIIIEAISIYGSYNYMNEVSSLVINTDDLVERIGAFHILVMSQDTNYVIPEKGRLFTWLGDFCKAGSLFYMYKFAYDLVNYKKIHILYLGIVILSLCNALLTGGRFDTVATIINFVVLYYVFVARNKQWKLRLGYGKLIKYLIGLAVALLCFPLSMVLLGRSEMDISFENIGDILNNTFYDLAVYVGAELKLLDMFVTDIYVNKTYNDPFGSHTLPAIYNFIATNFDKPEWSNLAANDIPFAAVNGHFLGNVYTMFCPYMIDFGYIGVVIFSAIMGLFFAYLYKRVRDGNTISKLNGIDMYLLIYAWLFYCVPLSFFSNWFYTLVAPSLIRFFLFLIVCRFLLIKNYAVTDK